MAADPISGAIQAGIGGLSSILSQVFSAGDRTSAAEAMRQAAAAYNIPLPVLQQMVAQQVGPSAMANVNADQNLVGDQNQTLGELQNISDSGGMTTEDQVNNEMLQRDAAQRAQAQRQSIVNTLSRSGVAPGGISAALQLGTARDQQEAGALAGAKTAADARRRATQAVLDKGTQAGNMRNQSFGEDSAKAKAADQIAQYNAQAQERSQRYNLGLPQQQYQNQLSRAAGQAGVQRQAADYYTNNANRVAGTVSDIGAGIGATGSGIYQAATNKAGKPSQADYNPYQYAPIKLDEEDNG